MWSRRRPAILWLTMVMVAASGVVAQARAEMLTPTELLERLQQSYNQIQCYQCQITCFARKGNRTENVRMEFAFKKPGMLRARVVAGSQRGSEVAIRRDGKIRGRQGGLLKAIKVSMDRDDRRLRNIRGAPVWDAEWGAFLSKLATALEKESADVVVRAGEENSYVADCRVRGANGPERHVYVVDRATFLLRSAEMYEGDTLVSRLTYDKERLNPELPDSYFNM